MDEKIPNNEQKNGNENISPTAWTIAHRRTFTDIPFSQEIFDAMEEIRHSQNIEIPDELKSPDIAPQIEARYKLVDRLLRENQVEQVLELASGFSPRGLEMATNSGIDYVELDLPGIIKQKEKIIEMIGQKSNLHLISGSALDPESISSAVGKLDPSKQLGIVHEGLLRYLNFDQKAIVAKNIRAIFDKYNGVWITPDITLRKIVHAENAAVPNNSDRVGKAIGINIDSNCFEDVDQAQSFFENLGFSVERHSFMEVVDELKSPEKLGKTRAEVEALIAPAHVFVMRTQKTH